MKNIILLTAIAFIGFVTAQNVYIPDPNFKNALVNHNTLYEYEDENGNEFPAEIIDTNGDGEISIEEAEAFDGYLFCWIANISGLTGIESFPNIKWLYCSLNNNLNTMDLSNNLALEWLDCSYNQFTNLDLSNNLALELLDCSFNNLTHLDLSNHTNLIVFACDNNQLTYLNVKNGNNQNFIQDVNLGYLFFATNNPDLECIEVDNATWSTQNWIYIDSQTTFSENCFASVNNALAPTNLTFFPNPFDDIITITTEKNAIENIKIYDIKGVLLYENQINTTEIKVNLSHFTAGIYFVKIKNDPREIT